jgi:hypothetical protein
MRMTLMCMFAEPATVCSGKKPSASELCLAKDEWRSAEAKARGFLQRLSQLAGQTEPSGARALCPSRIRAPGMTTKSVKY